MACADEIDIEDFAVPDKHTMRCDPWERTRAFVERHEHHINAIAECERSCKMLSIIVDNSLPIPFVYVDAAFSKESAPALFEAMRGLDCAESAAIAFAGWLACRRVQHVCCQRLMLVLCARTTESETTPEMHSRWMEVGDRFEAGDWGEKSKAEERPAREAEGDTDDDDFTERSPEVLRVLGSLRTASNDVERGIDVKAMRRDHDRVLRWMIKHGLILTTVDDDHVELTPSS